MDLYTLPAFIVVISVIVVIHELGHYWMARLFNTEIKSFSVGFGPELFGWTDKLGTRWKVCLLPLGGYVMFQGDENAASVPDFDQLEEIRGRMRAEGRDPDRILHLKPVYQRALVAVAGPLANFVFAIVLFAGFFTLVGEPVQKVLVDEVMEDSPAATAGLRAGDQVVAIDGWRIYSFNDLAMQIGTAADKTLRLTVDRQGENLDFRVKPERVETTYTDLDGRERTQKVGRIGIRFNPENAEIETYHHSLNSAIMRGYQRTSMAIDRTFLYLGAIVQGKESADQLGGPLRIAKMSGDVAQTSLTNLVVFIAFISVSVGLVNLFPIPILDGGHLLFYSIEAIRGRPLSARVQEIGYRIGMVVLALVFIFVTWNDIQFIWAGPSS